MKFVRPAFFALSSLRVGLVSMFLLLSLSVAQAAVLGAPANCKTLRAQRNALVVLGVKQNMKQGPSWAKQNLPEPEIYLIRHYMTIDEKVRFRCKNPVKKVVKSRKKRRKRKKKR